jgi:hypothetical protein
MTSGSQRKKRKIKKAIPRTRDNSSSRAPASKCETLSSNHSTAKKFLKSYKNDTKIYQNLWDTEKTVLRGKFTDMSAYI